MSSPRICDSGWGGDQVTIPIQGPATPYPAEFQVSGMASPIADVNLWVTSLTHGELDQLDVLLVNPAGRAVMVLSDAGGDYAVSAASFLLDDEAITFIPDNGPPPAGNQSVQPSTFLEEIEGPETLNSPAPPPPYFTDLSVFDGTNPNGTWKLYVYDDTGVDSGSMSAQLMLDIQCPTCLGFEADAIGSAQADNLFIFENGVVHTLGGDDLKEPAVYER
ncbi:MAG: hypothetical protein WEB00_11880 [Dehalococcoidia bacterium]